MTFQLPWSKRKAVFQYPISPVPRTVVFVDWFDSSPLRVVQTFAEGWTPQAAAFAPAAVAGTREQLLALAEHAPRLTHALIVLVRAGEPLTTAAERDQLWRSFGVPMFEQIIGEDGRLLAAECEAHDGLHVAVGDRAWDDYWMVTVT